MSVAVETNQQLADSLRGADGLERRFVASSDLEVRAASHDGAIPFRGHAAVFNEPAFIRTSLGGFHEQVAPGAFRKTLQEHDIRLLFNHSPQYVLARNRNGTLRLEEDESGLLVEADMLPTSYARDLALALERGDVSQMSFGFETIKDGWSETESGAPLRTLLEVKLWDVSPVTFAAYPQTDAALRSAQLDGLVRALGFETMPEEERGRLLTEIATGEISPNRTSALRAACEALGALACSSEPPTRHSGTHPSVVKAQAELMARGLPVRGGT